MLQDQILTPWVYRRWRFDFPSELYPVVIERLRGLPSRAEALATSLAPDAATRVPAGGWSVQRHLGHLVDLETLLWTRLDAYERGVPELPPADMSNAESLRQTHDDGPLVDLLAAFRATRTRTVERLESYPRDFFGRSAWHERLGVQMRVVDTCVFFADHDDHHLVLARHAAGLGPMERNATSRPSSSPS